MRKMMQKKHHEGIVKRYFHVLHPKTSGSERRFWAWKYIIPEIIIPAVIFFVELICNQRLINPDIIVSALGVLGGLLFAHAIFVFQLRMSYMSAVRDRISKREADGENTQLTRMIDELFDSVVYSSALALVITILVALGSSLNLYSIMPILLHRIVSAVVLLLIAHLTGCIYRVLRTTSSAYAELQKQKIS